MYLIHISITELDSEVLKLQQIEQLIFIYGMCIGFATLIHYTVERFLMKSTKFIEKKIALMFDKPINAYKLERSLK
jgi:hypothetical protein